jgi:hypothetical protein
MLLAMEMLKFLLMDWKGRFAAQAGHMSKAIPDRPGCRVPEDGDGRGSGGAVQLRLRGTYLHLLSKVDRAS